ncbi:MAG: hypothetical protein QM667_06015 [Asticcacaulis sp.]
MPRSFRIRSALVGFTFVVLTGCASAPATDPALADIPTPKACKAKGLVFTKDANGRTYCVTEAQAKCQQTALLLLGDADCLNTLMWKDNTSRPDPLPPGTPMTPKTK